MAQANRAQHQPSPIASITTATAADESAMASSISVHHTTNGRNNDAYDEENISPSLVQGSSQNLNQTNHDDAEESDTCSEFESYMRQGRIDVGQSWDDSSEEEIDHDPANGSPLALSSTHSRTRRRKRQRSESYLRNVHPSAQHPRSWWKILTNPSTPASLSAPHISANLFSASMHPAVLLSMPHYFARTGLPIGIAALVGVAILGGVGGGLWVVLSRYVNGNSVEAIVGASFGRYTRWKGGLGRVVSGLLLALYATGAAFVAYFALADLLLQIFFHYSPKGIPLHDRGFVTLVVGGLITAPMVIFPLAKRNLIRLTTFFSVAFYPIISLILLAKIYAPLDHPFIADPVRQQISFPSKWSDVGKLKWPNADPLQPPSIWAPISLLPLLTLSSSPLQILAHQRSLRRIGTSRSNVKAFLGAQAGQVFFNIAFGIMFGIVIGYYGLQGRRHQRTHPNLFASLPNDDHLINLARLMFISILAAHFSLCLITARSSWGRLLRLLNLNPLRRRRKISLGVQQSVEEAPSPSTRTASNRGPTLEKAKRQWGKLARNSLAGAILWTTSASTAYLSGAGGFRRKEKAGEEARFTRASEVLGLFGAAVGFVMPGLVWLILFHIRRPRAILPLFASELGRSASAYLSGPLGVLARNRKNLFGLSRVDQERRPLLSSIDTGDEEIEVEAEAEDENEPSFVATLQDEARTRRRPLSSSSSTLIPSHLTDSQNRRDEATSILLARKERQMQRRTRGKRIYQDIIVFVVLLPFGFALLILGAMELGKGGF